MNGDAGSYADMLSLSRPVSGRHARMDSVSRGAQFSPFAALTGLEDVLRESGRQTDAAPLLDGDEIARLDSRLRYLSDHPETEAVFLCFVPDGRKSGGAIVPYRGKVRRVDTAAQTVRLNTGTVFPISSLCEIMDGD